MEWVRAVADFQTLVAPAILGVLRADELSNMWRARMATLANVPRIMRDIPTVLT